MQSVYSANVYTETEKRQAFATGTGTFLIETTEYRVRARESRANVSIFVVRGEYATAISECRLSIEGVRCVQAKHHRYLQPQVCTNGGGLNGTAKREEDRWKMASRYE